MKNLISRIQPTNCTSQIMNESTEVSIEGPIFVRLWSENLHTTVASPIRAPYLAQLLSSVPVDIFIFSDLRLQR